MSAVSKLIEVSYKDATNYNNLPEGDVLGTVLDYFWGPVDKLLVLSRTEFYQLFPESAPFNKVINAQRYHAYAQIKRAFELGIPQVEVIRPSKGYETRNGVAFDIDGVTVNGNITDELPEDAVFAVASKYPGTPPKSLLAKDYTELTVKVSCTDGVVKISVNGTTDAGSEEIEAFEGVLDPLAVEDGQSIFIENVVSQSELISVLINPGSVIEEFGETSFTLGHYAEDAPSADVFESYLEHFRDTTLSRTTMLISPVSDNSCDSKIQSISKERQDLISVKGYPITEAFTKEKILSARGVITPGVNFSVFVTGREYVKLFGQTIISNCVGGWCGATANVARSVRTNQLASAFTYGAYDGVLAKTLTFSEVCSLHEEGVISIFNSTKGPLIWGVRALYTKQTSYYAKANVLRVLAEILRQWFPISLDAVHTDAASNQITKSSFHMRYNSVLDDMIAKQNILGDSTVTCIGDINSDVNTQGGKIFNVAASIHFIGLVERIKISITATDSSVTAKLG